MRMEEYGLADMDETLQATFGRFRYRQFIEKLGWRLPVRQPGQEWDQYDDANARYALAFNDASELVGCARLICTLRPTLLEEVFPQTCVEAPPRQAAIWEMTRFTTAEPQLGMPLFWRSLEIARAHGAETIVGVVNRAMERYYVQAGVTFQRLGPVTLHQEEKILAIQLPTCLDLHPGARVEAAAMETLKRSA